MERSHATSSRIHTPQIVGADRAVSSFETGGLHCEPSTQSVGETSFRMATACEKGGQETKHMGQKDGGICEVAAVGQLAKCCSDPALWEQCLVCTICRR